ncbi:MAG: tetraacyldisaccharide 4'-kinase [Acidobacteria bacterium]|nr:MAG: tetraacyldisaccharide 4'-kinase [Acidobacteriota bacterium]PYQ88906.1 MAG: tetraacyldisaccharide 4'-kinase [Acidobacteriota bacterium]
MFLSSLSAAYGAAATWRRRWYERDPARRKCLDQPVISVGNLRVGGSGKTPMVEYIARLLVASGERPAILTRGYARRKPRDGVTVVSDGLTVLAGLDAAGDEPLMLARAVKGASVLVGANRYLSGRLAERKLRATVHILDDGFQHVELARAVDLILVSEDDLADQPLPAGRLRERLSAAAIADAALVTASYDTAAERIARALKIRTVFRVTRTIAAPRMIAASRDSVVVPGGSRVYLVTGIARPDRFEADAAAAGWEIADVMTFRDHHPFDARDVKRIAAAAQAARSAIILTTEKDAVRLAACDLGDLPIAAVPLVFGVEPADRFRDWLFERLGGTGAAPAR